MSLKRFFILSLLSFFALSMFSCNEDEEKTNVKFEWNYVKRKLQIQGTDTSWVIDSSEKYVVDRYTVKKEANAMQIYGHTTSNDSIVISILNNTTFGDNPTSHVTVGEYTIDGNNKYSIVFFRQNQPLFASGGFVDIEHINSRVEMDFYSPLANGYILENGVADNLDVYLAPKPVDE